MDSSSFWNERSVFVTGATGLLGSWLVEALLARGAKVTTLVRDWVPDSRFVECGFADRVNMVRGELADGDVLGRAMNEYEVNTVFHLGAQAIVEHALSLPVQTFESNIRGTWNLLEACRACTKTVERVIVASSDKAYGPHDELPYTEDMRLQGRFPYDVSKSCADLISLSYFHTYRTPVVVTRCGNLFGGGDLNFNRLVPGTIRSALRREAPIVRSDGTYVRDYFYVKDAVEAYLRLAEGMPGENIVGQAFNFGTETPLSVLQVVDLILSMLGATALRPRILGQAAHEISRQYLDCAKARAVLDWKPICAADTAMRETIDWYRDYLARRN